MIFISGVTLSFFLSILVATKRNRSYADYLLAIWMGAAGLHQLLFYFDFSGFTLDHPFFAGVAIPFPLVHGPFLFLYVSAVTGSVRKKWMDALHFLPFILCFLYLVPFFRMPADERLFIVTHQGVGFETFVKVKFLALIISGIVYVIASLILIYRHQRNIVNRYSNLSKISLQWMKYLAYGLGTIWLVVLLKNETYTFLASIAFVMVIGFFGIRQAGVFTAHPPETPKTESTNGSEEISTESSKKASRYERSGLTAERKAMLENKLKTLLTGEKPYLNPDLTLDSLASQLEVSSNHLSQYLNETLGTTFYDYINMLRVQEFERLAALPDSQKFTLLALAYNSGFNSKASFNRHYKKVTGRSPSEYLRELR